MRQLGSHVSYVPSSHGAGCDCCIVPRCHIGCHRARFPRSEAPGSIGGGERSQVCSGRSLGRHDPRLGQQEYTNEQCHHYCTQRQRENCSRPALRMDRPWKQIHGMPAPEPPDSAPAPEPADSARAEAVADNVQGISDPKPPPTRDVAVTVSHPASSVTEELTPSPASRLTIPSTAPPVSPRAEARAPAVAASSNRSCVSPAAPPASRNAKSKTTAGKATANSAVTAPDSSSPAFWLDGGPAFWLDGGPAFWLDGGPTIWLDGGPAQAAGDLPPAGGTCVMARTGPCGSG